MVEKIKLVCDCKRGHHRTEYARFLCKQEREMEAIHRAGMPKWKPEGTKAQWLSQPFNRYQWGILKWYIELRDKGICQECGAEHLGVEIHHIIARMSGGTDHPENLKSLCIECHRKETNHLLAHKTTYHKSQKSLMEATK